MPNYDAALSKTTSQKRLSKEERALVAELEAPEVPVDAPAGYASPKPSVPVVKPQSGFWKETGRAVVGGIRDAVNNTIAAVDQGATYLDNNVLDLRIGSNTFGAAGGRKSTVSGMVAPHTEKLQNVLPEVAKNETMPGNIARGLVQFAVPFIGASKALAVPKLGRAANAMVAGAAVDAAVFDPHEARLSNLLVEHGKENTLFDNAVTRFLAASPEDGNAEGRLKNVLEGMGAGVALDGIFHGVKALKGRFIDKGMKPAEALQKAAGDVQKVSASDVPAGGIEPTTRSPAAPSSLADQIASVTGAAKEAGPVAAGRRAQKYLDMKEALREPGTTGRTGAQEARLLHGEPAARVPDEVPGSGLDAPLEAPLDPRKPALFQRQSGEANPAVLSHVASSGIGAVAGYNSAEDDASQSDKWSLAGLGAAAGLGASVKLAPKGLKGGVDAPRAGTEVAPEIHPVVRDLARPEVANIAPRVEGAKRAPFIAPAKAREFVTKVTSGNFDQAVKDVRESDFNFDHIDTEEDVKSLIDSFSGHFEKETSFATGGLQSHEVTKQLADEIGGSVKSLTDLYGATGNLAARVHAGRILLTASAERTAGLAKRVMGEGASADILAFRKQVMLHAAIQAQMKGVQTEVARALNQFRIQATTVDLAIHEKNALLDAIGGRDANVRFAELLDGIADPAARNRVIRNGAEARTGERLWWAWMQGLLSGPATHVANAVSNTAVAAITPIERAIGGIISNLPGMSHEIQHGEALEQVLGMVGGFTDALRVSQRGFGAMAEAAGHFMKADVHAAENVLVANRGEFGQAVQSFAEDRAILGDGASGTLEHQSRPISSDAMSLDPASPMGRTADLLGAVVGIPGRALQASDELFRVTHYRGELRALALREGRRQGLKGEELAQFMADTLENTPKDLADKAFEAAREGTFTAPLGDFGRWLQEGAVKTPALRFILPFIRTPMNILKFAGRRTPGLNALSSQVQADWAAGGARREMVMARTAFGGMLLASAGLAAQQGLLTGGGDTDQTSEKLAGWQPYSVKAGDEYVSLARIEPFGTLFGLAADFVDISGHLDEQTSSEIAGAIGLALTRNLTSKSYVQGLAKFMAAVVDPVKRGAGFAEQFAGSFSPAWLNSIRRITDDDIKEVNGLMDAVKSRIPGFSKGIPAQVDLFGRDLHLKGGWGPDLLSPVQVSPESKDPAAQELFRLNLDIKGPQRTLPGNGGGPGIDLTPEQFHRFRQLAGNEAKIGGKGFHEALNELVESDAYKALPENSENGDYIQPKERRIRVLQSRYQNAAKSQLLQEHPDLAQAAGVSRQNAIAARTGATITTPWWE